MFTLCTLKAGGSDIAKKQEIGRGLRLPVDNTGNRCIDRRINELTVIANDYYDHFASALQKDFNDNMHFVKDEVTADILIETLKSAGIPEEKISPKLVDTLKEELVSVGVMNTDNVLKGSSQQITKTLDNMVFVDDTLNEHAQLIKQQFKELMVQKGTRKIEITNGDNDPYDNGIRAYVTQGEFEKIYLGLRKNLMQRSIYKFKIDKDKFIDDCVFQINQSLLFKKAKNEYKVETGRAKFNTSQMFVMEELAYGDKELEVEITSDPKSDFEIANFIMYHTMLPRLAIFKILQGVTKRELLNNQDILDEVRFAPSPTGRMHVGNLRTALYEFLIAKHAGGDFILRIEDTDRERLVEGAVDIIYRTMAETGLVHDEGPDKDKGFGPYVQSERQASGLYLEYAKKLIESGDAYYCFCDKERLESLKTSVGEDGKEITVYDKHCLHLSKEEIQANLDAGKPYVIRINMPTEGTTTFVDELYGEITVENKELDDMILIKSDGYPTYNFANVVDDHLQQITHVVRGNEYISSSPKYQRLYEAFGWEPPKYVHLPLITDENHKKLSKRSGHASYEDLIEQGFLPEAVVNYLALLGWSPEDNREIFSLDELIKEFDYHKVNKSPSVFDIQKLKWMNGEYIKAMDNEKFYEKAMPYIKKVITKDLDLEKILDMVKTRIETFPELMDMVDFFEELPEYDVAMYTHKKMKTNSENSLEVLTELLPILEATDDYSVDGLHDTVFEYIGKKGCKNGQALWPLRTAVSGKQMTPAGAFEIMEVIGKEESISRIKKGIELLSK